MRGVVLLIASVLVALVLVAVRRPVAGQPLDDVLHARRRPSDAASGPLLGLVRRARPSALPEGDERPLIAHVAVVDLDRDGLGDILVCDALRGVVGWIRQAPRGVFTEQTIAEDRRAGARRGGGFRQDGDTDLLVGALGLPVPQQQPRRLGAGARERRAPARSRPARWSRTWPASPTRAPSDLDGDGDLDVAVAGFGYDDGETSWLENRGSWKFEQHVLQRLSGAHQRRARRTSTATSGPTSSR